MSYSPSSPLRALRGTLHILLPGVGLAGAGWAGFLLLARGRVAMDLGWGRSHHQLGPIEVTMSAPPDLVFEIIRSAYSERAPAEVKRHIKVLERSGDLVVAEHRTPLPLLDALTVETVRFQAPSLVEFSLLRGPVPAVNEVFELVEVQGQTVLTYRGTLAADLWLWGRWYGGRIVKPAWEGVVAKSLLGVKTQAEARAAAHRRRAGS
ncbi:MAG: hypothetical protein NVSMB32_02790 [Actinomycetota bacterium]